MNYPNSPIVLIVGKNKEILDVLLRVINSSQEYVALMWLYNDNERNLPYTHFDIVLFSSGLSEADDTNIQEQINFIKPNSKIIQHYGGGSGLLFNEIKLALAN
jgi:hypothetical protein